MVLVLFIAALPSLADAQVAIGGSGGGAPPKTSHQLIGDWYFGGRLEAEYLHEINYDLNQTQANDLERLTLLHPSLAFSWRPDAPWLAYINFEYQKHTLLLDEGKPENTQADLSIDKLFLDYYGEDFFARIGRQRVKHPREWMIDDTQDGIRLFLPMPQSQLDIALMRERAFTENLLHPDPKKRVDSLWLRLGTPKDADFRQALFIMLQRKLDKDEEAGWFGFEWLGEWKDLDYWTLGAIVRGQKRGRGLSGYGFDLGGVYRLFKQPRIFAIAGLAFGSGNPDDADLGFRQTGFQDNASKLGGVTRFSYYGEVMDPELSNMSIFSLGLGIRPVRNISVHLMWHQYRQHRVLDELRDSDLEIEPNGEHASLGQEIDLILGYRLGKGFRLEAVLGRFLPGAAFDQRDAASLARLEIKYNW